MGGYLWSDKEKEFLLSYANKDRPVDIYRKYNHRIKRYNKLNNTNYPLRTIKALTTKIAKLKGTYICLYDNWELATLADLLGLEPCCLHYWVRRKYINVTKHKSNVVTVTKKDFKLFAEQYPHLLVRANYEELKDILGKTKADFIASLNYNANKERPVINLRTKRKYESISQAARVEHYAGSTIHYHIKNKTGKWAYLSEYKGNRFKEID